MSVLHGFRIAVSSFLAGGKRAVKQGNTVFVSPAMYDLMSHAGEEELRRLLGAIELVEVPEMRLDSLTNYVSLPLLMPR